MGKRWKKWWVERAKPFIGRYRSTIGLLLILVLIYGSSFLTSPDKHKVETTPISTYFSDLRSGKVKEVELNNNDKQATVTLVGSKKKQYLVAYPDGFGGDMVTAADKANVPLKVVGKGALERYQWLVFIPFMLLLLAAVFWQSGLFGKLGSKTDVVPAKTPKNRFSDVGGADEVIERVTEIVDAFKHPEKYTNFGVKAATGLLLMGPPGTGKTLLARAIAGEAGVPFYAMTGGDFVGRYLNDGPRAVKEVFARLRKSGGGILFIDEFDTMGSKRTSNDDSGSKELNNIVNALLTEMDGFDTPNLVPILVIGATNRPEDLDNSVLRRFTVKEIMPTPDPRGRAKIIEIHMSKLGKVADDVTPDRLVRMTSGMSGDDIAKLLNEAGLAALKEAGEKGGAVVTVKHIMDALETRQLGSARRSRMQNERDRRTTAGHEAGHALVAFFLPSIEPPARVTIVPRGATGGHTRIESEDTELHTVTQLKAQLVYCMGGRAAEMLLENDFTTGATGDLQKATEIAKTMVGQAGMGPFLAQVPLDGNGHDPRLADVITEADKLIRAALEQASLLLGEHEDELRQLRDKLLEVEALDLETLREMFGEPIPA